ncbi:MAG: hypothetical protein ACJAYU_005428 [Bradymonadia bacterium]|jgi:hypothetical protein
MYLGSEDVQELVTDLVQKHQFVKDTALLETQPQRATRMVLQKTYGTAKKSVLAALKSHLFPGS